MYYAALGEKDEAFAGLEKCYDDHLPLVFYLKVDPVYDSLRDDPRFQVLLQKMGLE